MPVPGTAETAHGLYSIAVPVREYRNHCKATTQASASITLNLGLDHPGSMSEMLLTVALTRATTAIVPGHVVQIKLFGLWCVDSSWLEVSLGPELKPDNRHAS